MTHTLTKNEARALCRELNSRAASLMSDRRWQPVASVVVTTDYTFAIEFRRRFNRSAPIEGRQGTPHRLLLATSTRERILAHWRALPCS